MVTTIQRDAILARLREESVTAYDLGCMLFEILGVHTFEQAVQTAVKATPKTLRRIFSQGVPMCRSVDLSEQEQTHTDTLKVVDTALTELAGEAKVDKRQVLSAVLRYGNPMERVRGVLEDIRALVTNHCGVHNPTGLFVRLMRSGEDVRLPSRVTAKREVQARHEAPPTKALPDVGEWVKYQGDWLVVEQVLPRKVRLYAPPGYAYHYAVEDSDTDVSHEAARNLPRRAEAPPLRTSPGSGAADEGSGEESRLS